MLKLFFAVLLAIIYPSIVFSQSGAPIRDGQGLTVSNGQVKFLGLGAGFTSTNAPLACSAGVWYIYADQTEGIFKMCSNGTLSPLSPEGPTGGDLNDAFNAGDGDILGVTATKDVRFGNSDGTSYWRWYIDPTNGPVQECVVNGVLCDSNRVIRQDGFDRVYGVVGGTPVLYQTRTASTGLIEYHNGGRPHGSKTLTADAFIGDGTQCDVDPTRQTVGSEVVNGIVCGMAGTNTDGTMKSTLAPIVLPDDFDNTMPLRFFIYVYRRGGGGTAATLHGKVAVDCVGDTETVGTWGPPEEEVDVVFTTDHGVGDTAYNTTAAVFVDAAGSGCSVDEKLFIRYIVCDSGSVSAKCQSSAGAETQFRLAGVKVEYGRKFFSE